MGQRRLVLVPCPYQGHINPMLQLATILHSKGFSITIVHTKFNFPNPTTHPEFTFISIPDDLSESDRSSGNLTGIVQALNVNCVAPLEECLALMMKQQQSREDIACIIYDELLYFSDAVARRLGVPSVIFRTNTIATYLARAVVLQLIVDACIPLPVSALHDLVPGHYPLRFKDLPTSNFGTSESFLQVVSNSRKIRTSSAIIWNTTEYLEGPLLAQLQQQYHVPIFAIGPLHKLAPAYCNSLLKEDTRCISWLHKQTHNSVIYVSLGSVVCFDAIDFIEMAWGLAESKQAFLWVVRPGSVRGAKWTELLPEGFEQAVGDRGCIVKWAPQKQVLAHKAVGGFWTHCGWNSILESLCEGIPMICRPNFGDQKVTARYVSQAWKVGLQLENELEREEVAKAIKRLMVDREGEEMRLTAMDFKKKAESCLSEGGSSSNSLNQLVELIASL